MPDSKFERGLDRQAVLHDFKIRIIDLMENGFQAPDVGIYDEPVRYYKMNLQWVKIFAGWLSWMEHVAFWKDAEDEDYIGIQEILKFEEGIEMATKDDIRDGMYEAMNRLAAQIVSGRYTDIAIDEEGNVSQPSTGEGDAGLPEDDPTTPSDETETAKYGAMVEIAYHLEQVLDKIDTLYGATNGTPTTTEQDAQSTMTAYFPSDVTAMNSAVSSYYSWRATNNRFLFDGGTGFPQYLYCNGYDLNTLAKYFLDIAAYPIAKQKIVGFLFAALSDEFFSNYFSIGLGKPSSGYLDATCVPTVPQGWIAVPFASTRTVIGCKANHRIQLTFRGYVTDADGDIQDAFWYRTPAGVLTRTNPTIVYGAGSNVPTDAQVVYNSDHFYRYTLDLPNLNQNMPITLNKHANITTPTYSTDAFDISFIDFGPALGV